MSRSEGITRGDFLNGTQIGIGAAIAGNLLNPWSEAFGSVQPDWQLPDGYYPPSDANASADTNTAIAQAHRAVEEIRRF